MQSVNGESLADKYVQLCEAHGLKPIPDLELHLLQSPSVIDLSTFYFPRKQFMCVLTLTQERSDINGLILDGVDLRDEDIKNLATMLLGTPVTTLSFRNVLLTAESGEVLKKFCKENSQIRTINLEGTLLPPLTLSLIDLSIQLNRAKGKQIKTINQSAVPREAPRRWRRRLESMPGLPDREYNVSKDTESVTNVVHNTTDFYVDRSYTQERFLDGRRVVWHRFKNAKCTGSTPVVPSKYIDNQGLCAALNAVQLSGTVKKGIVARCVEDIGYFVFRVYVGDEECEVVVDNMLPLTHSGADTDDNEDDDTRPSLGGGGDDADELASRLLGVQGGRNDIWGPLLEKVVAKLCGGYDKLKTVSFTEALCIFSGGIPCESPLQELPLLKTRDKFDLVRQLLRERKILYWIPVARNSLADSAMRQKGIVPSFPYAILASDSDSGQTDILQLAGPSTERKYASKYNDHKHHDTIVDGFHCLWVSMEECLAVFDRICVLLHARADPMQAYRKFGKAAGSSEHDCVSSSFALNDAFTLENRGSRESEILVMLLKEDPANDAAVQFHFHRSLRKENSNTVVKRWDICPRNELVCSRPSTEGTASIAITLSPGEQLQLTPSSSAPCRYLLRASSFEIFDLVPAKCATSFSFHFAGAWDHRAGNARMANKPFLITNSSPDFLKDMTVALGQTPVKDNLPFAVSVSGWKNVQSAAVSLYSTAPEIVTELLCETLSVYRLTVSLDPGKSIALAPCCHDDLCPSAFNISFYATQRISCSQS